MNGKAEGRENTNPLSRRDFLRQLLAVSAAGGLGGSLLLGGKDTSGKSQSDPSSPEASPVAEGKSRVVLVRHSGVLREDNSVDEEILQKMVDTAVCQVTDKKERGEAWAQLVKPEDVVSLKTNCIAGITFCTRPEFVRSAVNGLVAAEVKPDNIIVWDRTDGELVRCGYKINFDGPGVKCYSSEKVGYGEEIPTDPEGHWLTQFSRILTDRSTALVNLPILKDHNEAGLTAALKNHMGSHNRAGQWHRDLSAVAYLNLAEPVRSRSRLCLCDALRPVYNGGPSDSPRFRWNFCGVIASTDPVAHDAVCAKIIQDKRDEVKGAPWPISPELTHLPKAASLGLGNLDWEKIELVECDLGA